MTYPAALDYLASLDRFGIRPGLERMRRLCEIAGHPERSYRSILVAGTNGKGSTCAFLTSILQEAGVRTGSSPKPHLRTPRERLQVNGELCPESDFAALVERIVPWIDEVRSDESLGPVTYFEAMTLMALLWFEASRVDWAVIEVGLGGRLDATNVVEPDGCVITNIGLDHMDRLGPDLSSIAGEKAGILRPGVPAVTGAGGEALPAIEGAAESVGAPLWRLGSEILHDVTSLGAGGSRFNLTTPTSEWRGLEIGLVGEHQVRNAALAVAAVERLRGVGLVIGEQELRKGLMRARLPGRLEKVRDTPLLLLDAAHNPDGARELVQTLRRLYLNQREGRRLILVLGLSSGHQPEVMAEILGGAADVVIATASAHAEAVPPAEVAALVQSASPAAKIRAAESVAVSLRLALDEASPEDVVCVTGSIFLVGEAAAVLERV